MTTSGRLLLLAATAGLLGCDKPAHEDTGLPVTAGDSATKDTATQDTTPPADADLDGWPSAVDCDDGDPTVFPGATETCNGVDDDCDGTVDDAAVDAATWYADDDGDGYGAADNTTQACIQPDGYLPDDQDCDATDATIHPGAEETCDGVDQDCDGVMDNNAVDAATWNADADGDGYGSATDTMLACEVPDGYLSDDQDCDDTDADVYPRAYDLCNDDVDQDCDGVDKSCPYSGVETAESVAYAMLVGEGTDDRAGSNRGLAIVPDMNADGYDELLIGAYYASTAAVGAGAAYIVYGPPPPGQTSLADADATLYEEAAYAFAGSAVASLGDVTGDGVPDFGVGAPYADSAGDMSGSFYVFEGGSFTGSASLSTAATIIDGTGDDQMLGTNAVGVGDIDGDGIDDMTISAPHVSYLAGAIYVFLGPVSSGSVSASEADLSIQGGAASDGFGTGLAAAGDTNVDGYADLLAGGSGVDAHRGRAYLYTTLASAGSGMVDADDATATFAGEDLSNLAAAVSGPSDINGDGVPDVVIGAYGYGASGFLSAYGRVYAFLAPIAAGSHEDADADVIITGDERGDDLGHYTAAPGDLNGDGADDLLVGGYGASYTGTASVFFGPIYAGTRISGSAGAVLYHGYMNDFGMGGIGAGGDANGDGYPDFMVAASLASDGPSSSGTVYFFPGGP